MLLLRFSCYNMSEKGLFPDTRRNRHRGKAQIAALAGVSSAHSKLGDGLDLDQNTLG